MVMEIDGITLSIWYTCRCGAQMKTLEQLEEHIHANLWARCATDTALKIVKKSNYHLVSD